MGVASTDQESLSPADKNELRKQLARERVNITERHGEETMKQNVTTVRYSDETLRLVEVQLKASRLGKSEFIREAIRNRSLHNLLAVLLKEGVEEEQISEEAYQWLERRFEDLAAGEVQLSDLLKKEEDWVGVG